MSHKDKKMQDMISVIIPVYKVEQYLSRCVDSIRTQEYQNLEILLVDDGSPDGCPAACDRYAEIDSRIKVIHKKNGGLSSARNAGLDAATGAYIAFVDGDDWLDTRAYSATIDILRQEDLDIACFEISRVSAEREIERYHFYETGTIVSGEAVAREILLDRIGSHVVKGVYRRSCWDGIRFPLGLLYEDIYVTFRVFDRAKRVGFIAEPYYQYWENDEGISLTPNPITPYHEYLGFKEHYSYAQERYPDISDDCLANAAMYAISTCFHYYSERHPALCGPCTETANFLMEHKDRIKGYPGFMRTRRLALNVFYFSRPLFKTACRVFHITGMQRILHFEMK